MILFPDDRQNAYLKAWVEKRLDAPLGQCRCLGVIRNDKLLAVAAFSNFRKAGDIALDIEISFASDSPRWATRQVVGGILSYPFLSLGTQRVTALCKKSTRKARRLLVGVGFREEGSHPHAAPNREMVMSYGMTKPQYLERYIGQQQKVSTDTTARAESG